MVKEGVMSLLMAVSVHALDSDDDTYERNCMGIGFSALVFFVSSAVVLLGYHPDDEVIEPDEMDDSRRWSALPLYW